MKPFPLDYEIAKLIIDQQGITSVLAALSREAKDRGMARLSRRLDAVNEWIGTPAGTREVQRDLRPGAPKT